MIDKPGPLCRRCPLPDLDVWLNTQTPGTSGPKTRESKEPGVNRKGTKDEFPAQNAQDHIYNDNNAPIPRLSAGASAQSGKSSDADTDPSQEEALHALNSGESQ